MTARQPRQLWRLERARPCCEASLLAIRLEMGDEPVPGDAFRCRECRAWLTLGVGGETAAVVLGRRGGRVGGLARAAKLSPERRREIASKASRARWGPPA